MSRTRQSIRILGPLFVLLVFTSPVRAQWTRGDVDLNSQLEITDPILILGHLFLGTFEPPCSLLPDVDSSGVVDISDPVRLLGHLFLGDEPGAPLSLLEERICVPAEPERLAAGMEVYENPDLAGNTFACLTCHDLLPDDESPFRRPGHSLFGALGRPHYKNGELDQFLDAANICREHWMFAPTWEEEDPPFLDLVSVVRGLGPVTHQEPIEIDIQPATQTGPSAGDAARGCELFHTSCVVCHGTGARGTERAPDLVFDPLDPLDPDYIRRRVRTSGDPDTVYDDLTGGVMPFWGSDRLSESELEDIVAFLTSRPVPQCREVDPDPTARVLRSGLLENEAGDISGTVEELSTRKIRIVEFSYDGSGEDVRAWLYLAGDPGGGRAIGENLVREAPGYRRETLVIEIPEDLDPESYDHFALRSMVDGELLALCPLEPLDGNGEGNVTRSGPLRTHFHDVAGTVEELDTGKLRFTNFTYDGAGIDVRVWIYRESNPQAGYAIGPDLLRPPPGWVNDTFVVDIPEAFTPDMYDSVSIWCVPVGVSFGDARLSTP